MHEDGGGEAHGRVREGQAQHEGMDIGASVQFVKGVGPQRAAALAELGVATAEDLLYHLPLRYEDRRSFARIADLQPGMKVSVAGIIAVAGLRRARRMGYPRYPELCIR